MFMTMDYFIHNEQDVRFTMHQGTTESRSVFAIGDKYSEIARIYATDEQLRQIANTILEYLNTKHPEYPDQQLILNAEHDKAIEEAV